jgi:RNA polymerase sigma factor (sigma-70 family)
MGLAAVPETGRATGVEPRIAPEATATQDLYERYGGQIFGFCMHRLGNREEAEDAVQQTFLNAFRGLQRGVVPELESAWLFKIAENVCLTRRRSSSRRGKVETPGDLQALQDFVAAPQRMGTDELIQLQDALAGMPPTQRRAILLREWQGLSYREIADEMELTQPAVETLIFRARRSLAEGLERAPQPKSLVRRLRTALDLGSLLGSLQGLFAGAAAVKALVTTAAVVGVAGAVVVAAPEPRGAERSRAPLPAVAERPAVAAAASAPVAAAGREATPTLALPSVALERGHRASAAKPARAHAQTPEQKVAAPARTPDPETRPGAPAPVAAVPAPAPAPADLPSPPKEHAAAPAAARAAKPAKAEQAKGGDARPQESAKGKPAATPPPPVEATPPVDLASQAPPAAEEDREQAEKEKAERSEHGDATGQSGSKGKG